MLITLNDVVCAVAHHCDLAANNGLLEFSVRLHDHLEVKTANGIVVSAIVERCASFAAHVDMLREVSIDLFNGCTTVCEVVPDTIVISAILAHPSPIELSEENSDTILKFEGELIRLPVLEVFHLCPVGDIHRDCSGPVDCVVNGRGIVIDEIPNCFTNLPDDRWINAFSRLALVNIIMFHTMASGDVVSAGDFKDSRGEEVFQVFQGVVVLEPLWKGFSVLLKDFDHPLLSLGKD
mmetsp:Transcript_32034/g.78003  ORF Transcript_32034/g.78003 Transcript_32034/m.78003 type:complete len:236 (+) Transcript_32034:253-960(+)